MDDGRQPSLRHRIPHLVVRDALEAHGGPVEDPTIRTVLDSVVIATNAGPLILVDGGPHPHADEHLVALLPEVGLVFQGDLVQFPQEGNVEAARPQTFALVELIDRLPWPVRQIAGVHGRVGTRDDLAAPSRLPARRTRGRTSRMRRAAGQTDRLPQP